MTNPCNDGDIKDTIPTLISEYIGLDIQAEHIKQRQIQIALNLNRCAVSCLTYEYTKEQVVSRLNTENVKLFNKLMGWN